MCLPVAVMAAASLATTAVGVGMQAYGQYGAGKAAKTQAQLDAARAGQQAQLANFNAGQIERYGELNANLVLAVSKVNQGLTRDIAAVNVDLINATTDFNTGAIKATTDFNVSSAEGAARLLEARGNMQAAMHSANAEYLEVQAQDTLEAGNQAERQSRAQYAQIKGAQRARLAANGVVLDEGSALRIQSDTDYASDVDADTIQANAMKAALGYRVEAVNERTAARFASLDGKAAALAKRTEAMASRLAGDIGIAQATMEGGIRALDTKLTASYQILQEQMTSAIDARNIRQDAANQSWAARVSALGYSAQSQQSSLTAKSINPALMAGTSLAGGAAQLSQQWYQFKKSGTFG